MQDWLNSFKHGTSLVYRRYFKDFEKFMDKSGAEMLKEARANALDAERWFFYPTKVFEFYKTLEKVQAQGKHGKPLSEAARAGAVVAVQSFFSFYGVRLDMKRFKRRDAKLSHPKVERKKHQLLRDEVNALMRAGDIRDRAILALGFMGQDESTVAGLRIEQFEGRLGVRQIEFIDLTRPKTNAPIKLLLTREVQQILQDYMVSLKTHEGWLFPGYKDTQIKPQQCNEVFKSLCDKAAIVGNGKRLSYHRLRMWFSTILKNKVSDDIIDLMQGHIVRYGGAYLADDDITLRELMNSAGVENLLRLQEASPQNGFVKELEEQKQIIQKQQEQIQILRESDARSHREMIWMRKRLSAMGYKTPVREMTEFHPKPKEGDVNSHEPKSETEKLKDEVGELRREIEALKKAQKG